MTRWPLTDALTTAWSFSYPTRYLRFAANLITLRARRGIPSPLD